MIATRRRWTVGERGVWRANHGYGRVSVNWGVIAAVDLPRLRPGVRLVFDEPDPINGATECYATHAEVERR